MGHLARQMTIVIQMIRQRRVSFFPSCTDISYTGIYLDGVNFRDHGASIAPERENIFWGRGLHPQILQEFNKCLESSYTHIT